jgi:hypothetical protein
MYCSTVCTTCAHLVHWVLYIYAVHTVLQVFPLDLCGDFHTVLPGGRVALFMLGCHEIFARGSSRILRN